MEEYFFKKDKIKDTSINKNKNIKKLYILFFVIFLFLFINSYISNLVKAPNSFPINQIISIKEGETLRSLSLYFKENNLIKSRPLFESFVIIFGGEKSILPGDYLFKDKLSVIKLADKISKGEKGIASIKITIPEGYGLEDIASIFELKLHNFNKENFLLKTENMEGYLFPDTYFFISSDDENKVIEKMSSNFEKRTRIILEELNNDEEKLKEIIIMASLLEREAAGDNDRDLISGILWKRLKINMPLQVDAEPNTYKERGLPKNPICNPGLKAINSAMNPVNSKYLYYIHDKTGQVHFAENFKDHRKNIEKYLK